MDVEFVCKFYSQEFTIRSWVDYYNNKHACEEDPEQIPKPTQTQESAKEWIYKFCSQGSLERTALRDTAEYLLLFYSIHEKHSWCCPSNIR
jgi:hypothetical protein